MLNISSSVYPNKTILICWLFFKNKPSKLIYEKGLYRTSKSNLFVDLCFDFLNIHYFRFLNISTTLSSSNSRFKPRLKTISKE